ncbi:MAG: hypothetical protein GXP43_00740 [bacterium]|nr:hypothetical protein [bacterium]
MRWKNRLLINYLALGVGFTALIVTAFITPRKGKIFVQEGGLPQGPVKLQAQSQVVEEGGRQILKVDFSIKNTTDQPAVLLGSKFEIEAVDSQGGMLALVNKDELVLPSGSLTANADRKTYDVDLFFVTGLTVPANGEVTGASLLPTLKFDITGESSYVVKVKHGGQRTVDGNVEGYNFFDVKEGDSSVAYDVLSGVEGDLVISQAETPPPPVTGMSLSITTGSLSCPADSNKIRVPITVSASGWDVGKGGVIKIYRQKVGSSRWVVLTTINKNQEKFERDGVIVWERKNAVFDDNNKLVSADYVFYSLSSLDNVKGRQYKFKAEYREKVDGVVQDTPIGQAVTSQAVTMVCPTEVGGPAEVSVSIATKPLICLADKRINLPVKINIRNWPVDKGGAIKVYKQESGSSEWSLVRTFGKTDTEVKNSRGKLIFKRVRAVVKNEKITGGDFVFYYRSSLNKVGGKRLKFKAEYKVRVDGQLQEEPAGQAATEQAVAMACRAPQEHSQARLSMELVDNQVAVNANLRLVNEMTVDSMDLVFNYSPGLRVDANEPFVIDDQLGSEATISKRIINGVSRQVIVNITGLHLGESGNYRIGVLKVQRDDGAGAQAVSQPRVWLAYTANSTVDTNVNVAGDDILVGVGNGVEIPVAGGEEPAATPTAAAPTEGPTPTPTNPPDQPEEGEIFLNIQMPVKTLHAIEAVASGEADYRKLPMMLFVVSGDEMKPVWWRNSVQLLPMKEPIVWMTYDYQNAKMTADWVASVTKSELEGADALIVKPAGFLAKRLVVADGDVDITCQASENRCVVEVNDSARLYGGDMIAGGSNRAVSGNVPVEDDLMRAYKSLLEWDSHINAPTENAKKYLRGILSWFGDDVINSFDTGLYPTVLGDSSFYINWFEGKDNGKYKSVPEMFPDEDLTKFMWSKWFNLLDQDGNRYLNALDWSIVQASYTQTETGGDLSSELNGGQ